MIILADCNWLRVQMAIVGNSLTKTNDGVAESAEQDQTARMCRLILLYTLRTLRKLNQ